MEIKTTNKKQSKVHILVSVTSTEMDKYFDNAYEAMAPGAKISGFRPGKAPRAMVVEAIGRQKLANAAIQEAVRTGYIKAIKENNLNPLGNPNIKINKQPSFIEGADNSLEFESDINVLPEVKFTKDYKKIKVSPIPQKKLETSDEEVDAAIKSVAEHRAEFKPVTRGAKTGDKVEITFQGFDKKVPIEQLASKNHPIILGKNTLIPGFEDNIIGIKKDETRKFKIAFPKDYHAKEFAGKKYDFEVTANAVEEVIPPKIDEEFAKKLGAKNLEDLKKLVRENIEQEKKNRAFQIQEDAVVKELIKITRVQLPEILVNSEMERLRGVINETLKKQNISFEKYLESLKVSKEKYDEDLLRQASNNVVIGLALRKIAKEEKIELKEDDSLAKVVKWLIEKNQPVHKVHKENIRKTL